MNEQEQRLLADLARHPAWPLLRQWAIDQKDLYFKNLAQAMFANPDTVTAEDLAYKRGYFKGVFRALNEPTIINKRLTPDDQEGDTA